MGKPNRASVMTLIQTANDIATISRQFMVPRKSVQREYSKGLPARREVPASSGVTLLRCDVLNIFRRKVLPLKYRMSIQVLRVECLIPKRFDRDLLNKQGN